MSRHVTCEQERPIRNAQILDITCSKVLSIDLCASSGSDLGDKWSAIACNEDGNLLGQTTTSSTSFKQLEPWLRSLATRVRPVVVVIDNVPLHHLDAHGRLETAVVQLTSFMSQSSTPNQHASSAPSARQQHGKGDHIPAMGDLGHCGKTGDRQVSDSQSSSTSSPSLQDDGYTNLFNVDMLCGAMLTCCEVPAGLS